MADPTNKIKKSGMLQNNIYYSCTMSPSDQHQFFRSNSLQRVSLFYKDTFGLLSSFVLDYATLKLVLEITSRGRLHYHGTIMFHDSFGYHLNGAYHLSQSMNVDIDTIDNMDNWERYYLKDKNIMYSSIKKLKLPYTITNNVIKKFLNKDKPKSLSYDITKF